MGGAIRHPVSQRLAEAHWMVALGELAYQRLFTRGAAKAAVCLFADPEGLASVGPSHATHRFNDTTFHGWCSAAGADRERIPDRAERKAFFFLRDVALQRLQKFFNWIVQCEALLTLGRQFPQVFRQSQRNVGLPRIHCFSDKLIAIACELF